jgi:hypothetical protein
MLYTEELRTERVGLTEREIERGPGCTASRHVDSTKGVYVQMSMGAILRPGDCFK